MKKKLLYQFKNVCVFFVVIVVVVVVVVVVEVLVLVRLSPVVKLTSVGLEAVFGSSSVCSLSCQAAKSKLGLVTRGDSPCILRPRFR